MRVYGPIVLTLLALAILISLTRSNTLANATVMVMIVALAAGRGPWALHNLAETLAHPTPLTWSMMRHFMSGRGGFGCDQVPCAPEW